MENFAKEITRGVQKVKVFRPVESTGVHSIWAMDLADMSDVMEDNDEVRYILCIVDVFSRFAWCFPLKRKDSKSVFDVIKPLLDKYHPNALWTDQGAEFYNTLLKDELKKQKILLYSTYSDYKVSVVERFIRTLKKRIWVRLYAQLGTRRWLDFYKDEVNEYNNTKHRTIGMSPTEALAPESAKELLRKQELRQAGIKETKPKFAVGDYVRISRKKGAFEKEASGTNWSMAVYKIREVRTGKPPLYYVSDYDGNPYAGAFYDAELQKSKDPQFAPIEKVVRKFKRKGKDYLVVKFVGYDGLREIEADALSK